MIAPGLQAETHVAFFPVQPQKGPNKCLESPPAGSWILHIQKQTTSLSSKASKLKSYFSGTAKGGIEV